jgi:hypothetical protein
MGKREEYELILNDLKSAQNEDDVVKHITKIIKVFSSDYYKNDLYENPYFKTFIPDVKEAVVFELEEIRKTIKDEIKAIEDELLGLNGISLIKDKDVSKLKNLKKECVILIKELDNRLEDLYFL